MRLDLGQDDGTCRNRFRSSLIASAGSLSAAMPADLYAAVLDAIESDDPAVLRAVASQLRAWGELPPQLGHAAAEPGAVELGRSAAQKEKLLYQYLSP
jgi:hypothetical protein